MPRSDNQCVQLDRTFHDLDDSEGDWEVTRILKQLGHEKPVRWNDLLQEPRVVLLSEAGSAKTTEIKQVCRGLRDEGKRAFFLRIEDVASNFDISFEEGTQEDFESRIASSETGWLFLDSIDEARLKDPKHFELAIKSIGRRLRGALQRVHIVITGRTTAWRPITDLQLCETALSSVAPTNEPTKRPTNGPFAGDGWRVPTAAKPNSRTSPYRIAALADLSDEQIDRFAARSAVHFPGS